MSIQEHKKDNMDNSTSGRRIVLLGKTGVGKSSVGNTIFEEAVYKTGCSPNSTTKKCKTETRTIDGREITLIDPPGFFDTNMSEDELKAEILRCIVECAPGPHAFVIVLEVARYTEQEKQSIKKMEKYFSPEAFKYATVLFTHGDQLDEHQSIQEFVAQSYELNELVQKCGGGCHVIDNKYWNNDRQDGYKNNRLRVAELLNTIDTMVEKGEGRCFTTELLQDVAVAVATQAEMRENSTGSTPGEVYNQAKEMVLNKLLIKCMGLPTGALIGALLGGLLGVAATGVIAKVAGGLIAWGVTVIVGYYATQEANTPREAIEKTLHGLLGKEAEYIYEKINERMKQYLSTLA